MENTNNDVNTVVDATNNLGVGANQTAFDGTVQGASFQLTGGVKDIVNSQNPSGGYRLDGVDDNINAPLNTDIVSTGELTVSCFIKNDSTNSSQEFVTRFNGSGTDQFKLGISGTGDLQPIIFEPAGNLFINENTNLIPSGSFNHVVMTYAEGKQLKLFVDGSLIDSKSSSSTLPNSSSDIRIGQRLNNTFEYDGIIDDVRIYNRALSASEINQIFNNTEP
jgi:sialidase-1